MPWTLYRLSIPPRSPPAVPKHEITPAIARAHSSYVELRALELFYLALTVVSPLLGATLLRYVTAAVTGNADTLSWFSTGLFVLATGVRPWTHLIERLKDRSRALNELVRDAADKDDDARPLSREEEIDTALADLRARFNELDTRVTTLATRADEDAQEALVHMQDVVDGVDKALRRHRAEQQRAAAVNDARVALLEERLRGIDALTIVQHEQKGQVVGPGDVLYAFLGMPWAALVYVWRSLGFEAQSTAVATGKTRRITAPPRSVNFASTSSSQLDPIPEEDNIPLNQVIGSDSASDHSSLNSDASFVVQEKTPRNAVVRFFNYILHGLMSFLLSPFTFAMRLVLHTISLPQTLFRALFS